MLKVWFSFLFLFLFNAPVLATTYEQCSFIGKFAELSEYRKVQVLNCPIYKTWYSDSLNVENAEALISAAINTHPETDFLSNFLAIQDDDWTYLLLKIATKNAIQLMVSKIQSSISKTNDN